METGAGVTPQRDCHHLLPPSPCAVGGGALAEPALQTRRACSSVPMAVAQVTPGPCARRGASGLRSSVGAGRLPPGASCSDALGNRVAFITGGPGRLDEGPSSPLSASLHLPSAATRGRSCPVEAAVPTLRGLPGPGIFGAGKPALLSPCAAWRLGLGPGPGWGACPVWAGQVGAARGSVGAVCATGPRGPPSLIVDPGSRRLPARPPSSACKAR